MSKQNGEAFAYGREIYEMPVVDVRGEWIMYSYSEFFICSDSWKIEGEGTFIGDLI